ncbi:g_PROTEIN_RECEP_F1_2 domain-containing protein [Caerostris extrusa]|uniref:G_PROTEIN_RECEP_F1_2 domain-containing protein n=1 Tax=Caerostris extrusa TaxID=172846 RepID=A0AAV4T9T5_CAEEX|nr:g_PROTEIN_RECEP_F1_2 domain-containing protein [Caerostris extrusa]
MRTHPSSGPLKMMIDSDNSTSENSYLGPAPRTSPTCCPTSVLRSGRGSGPPAPAELPAYIRIAATAVCAVILTLGTAGNVLVATVVWRTKELRNSTNLFLINLSMADLVVLLVCVPPVLVELHSMPEQWMLGEGMCEYLFFPFFWYNMQYNRVAHANSS